MFLLQLMGGGTLYIKKHLLLSCVVFLIFISFLFSSCIGAGLSDWSYRINDSYEIARSNSEEIKLCKIDGHIVVSEYITDFCYNDKFVCVKRIIYNNPDIPSQYFIIDMDTDKVYGPFVSQEDFNNEKERVGVGALSDWISTDEIKKSGIIYPTET